MHNLIIKTLMLFALPLIPADATAYSADYYTQSSALSSGKWVKVKVTETGIHQISHDGLRAMGFSDPAKVTVSGYGGARMTGNGFASDLPDDLRTTAVCHTADGRMLFYAEADLSVSASSASAVAVRRNLYGTEGCYFLTDSQPLPELPAPLEAKPEGDAATEHLSVCYIENETQNPADGGAVFHDRRFNVGESCDYVFAVTGFKPGSKYGTGHFGYSFGAYALRNTALEPVYPEGLTVSDIVNKPAGLQTQETKFYSVGSGSATLCGVAADGDYTVSFRLPDGANTTYTAMDYAWLIYPRENCLNGSSLVMNLPDMQPGATVSVTGPEGILVWDISDPANVTPCAVWHNKSEATAVCPGAAVSSLHPRRLIAFDPAARFPEAVSCGDVANQNLHGEDVPEMVIITTDEFAEAAGQFADLHRSHDGMDVKVVTQEKIFNEFSSGSRAAMGYRRYLKMLYDRAPKTIKYVLIYGHGSWDNRRDTGREELICYETENVDQARDRTKNFTSDKYFVMLENNFNATYLHRGIMSLSVGRIDVASVAEARKINAKIGRFLNRPRGHDIYGNILVLSDDGDEQGHFLDAEKVISDMAGANPTFTYTRAHNLIYPWEDRIAIPARKAITAALRSGQGLFVYSGHCNHSDLTGERLYDINLINSSEYDDYPFAMLATCETFGFDRNSQVIGPSMLRTDNGGAIGVIGSCRSVYMEYNRTLACAVGRAYAQATPATTIGDISRIAHNYCIRNYTENDRAANNLCYNLCGDPALKVGAPDRDIVIDLIDGQAPNTDTATDLGALKTVTVEGHVEGPAFNGDAVIRVFDTPFTVQTDERTNGEDKTVKYDVTIDEKLLAMTTAEVIDGKFTATLTVPEVLDPTKNNRLTVSAIADDGSTGAVYMSDNFRIVPAADAQPAGDAPVITEMFIGSPSFTDGSTVGSSIVLYASIDVPQTGLNLSQTFGSGIKLMLDNRTSYEDIVSSVKLSHDGTAEITFPIKGLADGHHGLTLTAASTTGVTTSRTITFTVIDSSVKCSLTADDTLVRDRLTLSLNHDFNSEPSGRIVIEDAAGNTVYSDNTASFPFEWDLRDLDGEPVADGRYRAYGILADDLNYSSTPALEFTVIR